MLKYIKLFIILALMNRCGNSTKNNMQLNEGNKAISFGEINIGKQIWMAANLNAGKFRNGDLIAEAKTFEQWKQAGANKQPAWCYYDHDSTKGTKYGKLYNWYAVNDPRGLAPNGYHIPTYEEWTKLRDYLGGASEASTKMKSTSGWIENGNGTNSSGFSGLPGGLRYDDGAFGDIDSCGYWWSSSEPNTDNAWYLNLDYNDGNVYGHNGNEKDGFSVRCLRD